MPINIMQKRHIIIGPQLGLPKTKKSNRTLLKLTKQILIVYEPNHYFTHNLLTRTELQITEPNYKYPHLFSGSVSFINSSRIQDPLISLNPLSINHES